MMKKLLSFALLAMLLAACTTNDNVVKVTGKVANAIPQGEILLERIEQGKTVPVAQVNSDHEGNFEMEVAVEEPGFYRLNVYGQQFEILVLNQDDLTVTASGQGGSDISVTGSRDMEYLTEVNEHMQAHANTLGGLNQEYIKARQEGKTELVDQLTDQAMALEVEKVEGLKKMAMGFDASLVSLMITDYIDNKSDHYYFLDSLVTKLQKEIPNSTHVKFFATNLPYLKPAVAMGDIAPEISLPNPMGETVSLSDLKGKYVLLDFWAGWCKPCRRENPNVVAMYEKYNSQGFEVFSVSLDRTRDRWVGAIQQDGLKWPTHVSDLKYFQSSAAIDYKVNAIPFALLLDPEGRVIGKNLRGRRLQAKLAEIFGEGE